MRITISALKKYLKTTKPTNKLTWLLLGKGWSKRNIWEGRMVGCIYGPGGGMHSKWWSRNFTRRNFSDDATVNAEWIKMARDMRTDVNVGMATHLRSRATRVYSATN